MSGIVVSAHIDQDKGELYYDFEDGQTRMSILQDFYMDRFPFNLDKLLDPMTSLDEFKASSEYT